MVEHWDEAGAEDGSEDTAIEEKPPGAVYLTCCVTACGVEVGDESRAEGDSDHSEDADDDVEEVGHDDVADDTTEVASADDLSPGTDGIEASSVGGGDSFPATATAGEPSSRAARMAAGRMARRNLEGCNQEWLSWHLGSYIPSSLELSAALYMAGSLCRGICDPLGVWLPHPLAFHSSQ